MSAMIPRHCRPFAAILICCLCCLTLSLAAMTPVGTERETWAETPHPYAPSETAGAPAWVDVIEHTGAAFIKIHFSRFDLAPGDRVIVRSPDGGQSFRYENTGRKTSTPGTFWATFIRGDAAVVELFVSGAGGYYGYAIDRYVPGEPGLFEGLPGPESVCGSQDWENAACYSGTMHERARAVTRYMFQKQGSTYVCSGWLVGSEGHVMSNNHCIEQQSVLDTADFEFMAEGSCGDFCDSWGFCGGPVWSGSATLVETNSYLDYSLYHLSGGPQNSYGFLQVRESGPVVGEEIFIAQHPNGWGKKISRDSDQDSGGTCKIASLNPNGCAGSPGVHYYCDTAGGSSGSPVLSASDFLVVALHNCGGCTNSGLNLTGIGDDLQGQGLLPQDFYDTGGGPCTDGYEPNDDCQDAAAVGCSTPILAKICDADDVDYFEVTPSEDGQMTVSMSPPAGADFDMKVYSGGCGSQLCLSNNSGSAPENCEITVTAGTTYVIEVYGYNGNYDEGQSYMLVPSCPQTTCGDAYEPNDSCAIAHPLSCDTVVTPKICTEDDEDYLSITPSQSGTLTVNMTPAPGRDYDLYVYNANCSVTYDSSLNGGDASEQCTLDAVSGQTYVIRVFGYSGAHDENASYSLSTVCPTGVPPPTVNAMTKKGRPFRLKLYGGNFQPGLSVYIDGYYWGDTTNKQRVKWKNEGKIVIKKGGSLKANFPKDGSWVPIQVRNPDGGQVTIEYNRAQKLWRLVG